ncbi:MAG: hypothetical protein DYG91_00500 [Chloroflexi bacterium CFX7]|nr:hypothetical protein [Chloroflexi bacterium CFX7]RIL03378.1 MAG: hypothetical protein DCC78_04955 [bacterium]
MHLRAVRAREHLEGGDERRQVAVHGLVQLVRDLEETAFLRWWLAEVLRRAAGRILAELINVGLRNADFDLLDGDPGEVLVEGVGGVELGVDVSGGATVAERVLQ